jgi:flagellar hook protein FlgE
MFTAIGALSSHQIFMDVVADNLANVNTTAFKSNRVNFLSQFAQRLQAGSSPTADLGGINPTQVGLGVRLGAISANLTQGTLQETGRMTDIAIQGDGFFIFRDGTSQFYSRDGAIDMDSEGYLVNVSTGMRLQGWTASGSAAAINTGAAPGDLQIPLNSTLAQATTGAILQGNLNSMAASGSAGAFTTTMGVYDSLGVLHNVSVTFTQTTPGNWNWVASGSAGNQVGTGAITFDTNGQFVSGTGSINMAGSPGAAPIATTLDFSNLTQLATASDVSLASQNGLAAGALSGFSVISSTGELYGVYSNGLQQRLGQLALATFTNPAGLERLGQNMYGLGLNSGTPSIGVAGVGGRGTLVSGYLEASNVDMAQEFTSMILAQRGFQASSRVISTSDEMLQELVNLRR